ncbi:MAG: YfcE family phosphodiesterase, partial [Clostridia bacterium]|nr:YfcE family phosphodiesterase [Clostridia bacterium]
MKVAVFSDTHGSGRIMTQAVSEYLPDQIIHLGDGFADAERLAREFPAIPVCAVPGNCDEAWNVPESKTLRLGPLTAFLAHGHRHAVRGGRLDVLLYAAECSGAQIAMFGHTHRPLFEQIGGIFVLNPGAAGPGKVRTWA